MRQTLFVLSAAAWLAFASSPVRGDRVYLTNGNFLEGQAEVLEDGSVAVTSAMGTWTVAADRVARVERSETVEQHVEKVLRATSPPDPAVLYDLAVWSRDRGAETLARQLAQRAIELDPEYEPARRLLGYRFHEGRWLTEEEWRRATGQVRSPEQERRARELAFREAQARLAYQNERLALELRARELAEREAGGRRQPDSYGFPLDWVLWAPTVPAPLVAPVGGIVQQQRPQVPTGTARPAPPPTRAPAVAPASRSNRSGLSPRSGGAERSVSSRGGAPPA